MSSPATPLCSLCKTIALHEALERSLELWKESPDPDKQTVSLDIPWHSTVAELSSSSGPHCTLCTLALQGLEACWQYELARFEENGDIMERTRPKDADVPVHQSKIYLPSPLSLSVSLSSEDGAALGGNNDRTGQRVQANLIVAVNGRDMTHPPLQATVRVATSHDDPAAELILGRNIEHRPDSERAFSEISSWVNTCINDHQRCRDDSSIVTPLPTRVLDVGDSSSDTICLRDDDNKVESASRYVALSHCRGKEMPCITTTENLADRKREILVDEMPKVFQDAVLITRRLGVRYLWIDALCIIQDDPHDWQIEAGRMTSVYMDAFVVIGASNSSADAEGFLHPRKPPESVPFVGLLRNGQTTRLDLQLLPPKGERWTSGKDPVSHEPLQSRAWCLQERYLCRRILLYGAEKIFWECREVARAEDGDAVFRNGGGYFDRLKETAAIETSIFGPRPAGDAVVNYRGWYEMVEEYMRRLLSYGSDRFPALSGLTNALAQYSKDEYLSGIWRKGLIDGLLWCGTTREKPLKKPTAYRAPSWSWAAVDGPIQFIVYNFFQRCKWKRGLADFEALATYVGHGIETEGDDPYGGIRHGFLQVNAPLFPVKSVHPCDEDHPPFSGVVMTPLRSAVCNKVVEIEVEGKKEKKSLYLQAGFDIDIDVVATIAETQQQQQQQPLPLFVLLLARLPDGNIRFDPFIDHRFGLLLRQTEKKGVYERVGIVDSPVLEKYNRGILMKTMRMLEKLRPRGEQYPISLLMPRLFTPTSALRTEPEEEMPADPLPEIRRHAVTVSLV